MTNLTITLPDELLQRARVRAARERTSVNSVLRARLAQYVDDEAELGQAWDDFLDVAGRASGRSAAAGRDWRREDLQHEVARAR